MGYVADSAAMREVEMSLEKSINDLKEKYAQLTSVVDQIRNHQFKGQAADLFVTKFEEKEELMKNLVNIFGSQEEKMTQKGQEFNVMMDHYESEFK